MGVDGRKDQSSAINWITTVSKPEGHFTSSHHFSSHALQSLLRKNQILARWKSPRHQQDLPGNFRSKKRKFLKRVLPMLLFILLFLLLLLVSPPSSEVSPLVWDYVLFGVKLHLQALTLCSCITLEFSTKPKSLNF